MYSIDYNSYRSVKGFNSRVRFLVMHYTALNFADSVEALTGDSVSIHYLVPDPKDSTYLDAGFKEIKIFNIVDESERAWHAGVSSWAGRSSLNDTSLGIEIVNVATDNKGDFYFPPYNPEQINAVKQLAKNIIQRYPDITPVNVVGHSDIAPGRKNDPGAAFPWKELYNAGIGAWYESDVAQKYRIQFDAQGVPSPAEVREKLRVYGYDVSESQDDAGFTLLLRAFQLHFRPEKYTGELDVETASILYALVDKYFPGK